MANLSSMFCLDSEVQGLVERETFVNRSGTSIQLSRFNKSFYDDLEKHFPYKRSLAKDGFIALHCLEQAFQKIDKSIPADKIGTYGAALNGPLLYQAFEECRKSTLVEEIGLLKKKWPPKQHFKQNAPLRATHYSMVLKAHGPIVTMVDPMYGLIDALNWAEIDLFDGTVECAIVIAAFALEDVQLIEWYSTKSKILSEAGVCLILEKGDKLIQHSKNEYSELKHGQCSCFFEGQFYNHE